MSNSSFRTWFESYLLAFAAGNSGSAEFDALIDYYAVPLVVTTPAGVLTLTSREQVSETIRHQLDGLRDRDYTSTVIQQFDITVLNDYSASIATTMQRRRGGAEILESLTMTYLITGPRAAPRISVMAVGR